MRLMKRNSTVFWYAPYLGTESNELGEAYPTYGRPVKAVGNVAPPGSVEYTGTHEYGVTPDYDRLILMGDPNFPMDEHSVLWIDCTPDEPHDFIVVRVARSLNHVQYAVRKVVIT